MSKIILTEKEIQNAINSSEKKYLEEQAKLQEIYNTKGQGKARDAAGKLTESILAEIFDAINLIISKKDLTLRSIVGSKDYLTCIINWNNKEGKSENLQVDRHVYLNDKRIAFIENKTYLDACYYDRALSDFEKIIFTLKDDKDLGNIKFLVLSGQDAMSDKKRNFLESFFELKLQKLGLPIPKYDVFYFLDGKRTSNKPIYNHCFDFNKAEIRRLILFLIN